MIKQTDLVKFTVTHKINDGLVRQEFKTFASAAGHAEALNGLVRMINVQIQSQDGNYSHSGTLHIYSKDNTRRIANKFLVNEVMKRDLK